MKRMLFNATHPEELRVAIVDGQRLLDLDIESATRTQLKGNIYKGTVTRVEPSLEAAFVDYGAEKQGFLPLKEISRAHFQNYSPATPMAQVKIQDVIREKQTFLVQVEKDERGTKGAALTTFVSLAGRYLVLMPNNPKGGGISRQIIGEERIELRDAMGRLTAPSEHSLIARTAGIGKSPEELQWDLDFLLQLWQAIDSASREKEAPFLVYQESNLIVRAIRDYLRSDIQEIVIDEQGIFERAARFMEQVMPDNVVRLKHYQDTIPLFSRFQIEHQIENAYSRSVDLASGGSLVIDHTEALVTVDVNSARATKGADIEETALQTNLEAVDEIARQLRIRDLGGLIVLDLIDMSSTQNKKTVEMRLHEAVRNDRARIQVGHISRFGLLEMSRQRLRSSISESNYQSCTLCKGTGQIRNVTSSSLSLLRILEEEALKENTEAIIAEVAIDTATFLLNEKRYEVSQIEARLGTRIVVLPSENLLGPQFSIRRMRSEEIDQTGYVPSHELKASDEDPSPVESYPMTQKPAAAAVRLDQLDATPPPAPLPPGAKAGEPSRPGLLARLWSALVGTGEKASEGKEQVDKPRPRSTSNRRRSSGQGQRSGGGRKTSQGRGGGGQGRSRSNDTNTSRDRHRQARGGSSSGRGRRPRGPRRPGTPNPGQDAKKRTDRSSATETKQGSSPGKTGTGG
ncbi:MAG: Rne/Rng family ribonuclease [Pseudomonadota bacterium]|nr:Rne/Rng family ribonuclease [Pseudomonadota bacterium]